MPYVVLLLVCFSSLGAFGQATSAAGSTSPYPVMVYTPNNKTDVPIDRRFWMKLPVYLSMQTFCSTIRLKELKSGHYPKYL